MPISSTATTAGAGLAAGAARERRAPAALRPGGSRLGWSPAAPLAVVLLAAWLIVDPRTPDLAAQVYRVDLFGRLGFAVWDEHWYAGHHLPGYSLLLPPLGSLVGLRLLGVLAVLASTLLFERLMLDVYGPSARWAAAFFALAAVCDVWIGRIAFALGVTFALAAALAFVRGRRGLAASLAVVCAAASPVAGALLALGALTHALADRSPRALIVLAAPVAALLIPLALLFPEGGFEPFPFRSFLATAGVALAFLLALPPHQRLLRVGAAVFLLACVVSLLVHTPMGSNIERYAVLLAGPLLLAAHRGRPTPVAAVALCAIAVWVLWGPVRETSAVAGSPATQASYYAPVERFLARNDGGLARVEVPLTRSHWEAALLAPDISLARGWEKQLEDLHDRVLLSPGLTAASYRRWLDAQAVSYVALPDVTLDPSSAQEGRLIRGGLAYLRPVFSDRHWRIFAVHSPTPILSGPGRLTALGHDSVGLLASAAGNFTLRVHYTRYWTVLAGRACAARTAGDWTRISVSAPGAVRVEARFSLGRALGLGGPCPPVTAPTATSASASAARAAAAGAPAALSYRWLARTSGAPPSVAQENAAAGTTAWRLPGPALEIGGAAHGAVAAYVGRQSLAAGERETVYVDAHGARSVTAQVFRMGWYGGRGGRLVLQSSPLRGVRQPRCSHAARTGLTECRWHPTLSFAIPRALPSGVYIVKLSTSAGAQSDCLFVLRASRPPRLLVEIPTATYEAYNAWGGDSLYPGGSKRVGVTGTTQGVEVSYDRPYDSQTGAGQFFIREVAIVRFLERYGYPAGYTTIESLDEDPGQVHGVRTLLDVGHSEYWSLRDAVAFAQAHGRGASLIYMSSDTMGWRVRFEPATGASSQAGAPGHRIVAYKEFVAKDPDRAEPSGLFASGGASLVGSAYDGCITPRLHQAGPPVYRYYPWSPAPGLRPRWLFAGTGIGPTTRVAGIVGYELDQRTTATKPGARLVGWGAAGACARAAEPAPARGALAESTLYTGARHSIVLATGTLGWLYALSPVPQASPDAPRAPDRRVVAMTRKLLDHALAGGG
ncbi:MAG TPA: N,N-dimethylformamidase beta subunit family domain-containing protein [Solirubrobacteraceae bacterium]|nr:N,N-dimethylformamidase beta subunit family domain-containing protein [Solirubrobacteraceae bacterium]